MSRFAESWLTESPMHHPTGRNMFGLIAQNINELLAVVEPTQINSQLAKIDLKTVATYWYHLPGDIREIQVAVEFNKIGNNLEVAQVGKLPGTTLEPTELYLAVLNDAHNIRLSSDKLMSAGGLNIWKNILKKHVLSFYDTDHPDTLTRIKDESDLVSLFGDDPKYKKFQYVLHETQTWYADALAQFGIRRTRKLSGYPEDEL